MIISLSERKTLTILREKRGGGNIFFRSKWKFSICLFRFQWKITGRDFNECKNEDHPVVLGKKCVSQRVTMLVVEKGKERDELGRVYTSNSCASEDSLIKNRSKVKLINLLTFVTPCGLEIISRCILAYFLKKGKNIVIIDLETQAQILINRFNKMEIFDRWSWSFLLRFAITGICTQLPNQLFELFILLSEI